MLNAGLRSGSIFWWAWKYNVVLNADPDERIALRQSKEDRDHLVCTTLLKAVPLFRTQVLAKRLWQPNRRNAASLRTFFIGHCLHKIGGPLRTWQRKREREMRALGSPVTALELTDELLDSKAIDPERYTETADLFEIILRKSTPNVRMVCFLLLQGYTQTEIAEKLGTTTRTVEGQMARLRKRTRQMVEQGRIARPGFLVEAAA